jgi:hypothetical protein
MYTKQRASHNFVTANFRQFSQSFAQLSQIFSSGSSQHLVFAKKKKKKGLSALERHCDRILNKRLLTWRVGSTTTNPHPCRPDPCLPSTTAHYIYLQLPYLPRGRQMHLQPQSAPWWQAAHFTHVATIHSEINTWLIGLVSVRSLGWGKQYEARRVVKFTPWPLYLQTQRPRYPAAKWGVGPRTILTFGAENISCFRREMNHDPSIVQPVS